MTDFIRDITEQKQTEKNLINATRLKELLFGSPAVIYSCKPSGDFGATFISDNIIQQLGYTPEQFIGNSQFWINHIHPDDSHRIFSALPRLFEIGQYVHEYRFLHKDGNYRWMRDELRLIYNADGKPLEIIGSWIDITERKQAEEALLKSEAKYRSMMESMTDPVYICLSDFTVGYMNPAMIKRIGRDATGERCHRAIHGQDKKCEWCVFNEIRNQDRIDTKVLSPLDNRTYRVTNMPIHHEDGTVSKMFIFRDITDYLNAVAEKNKAQTQLRQSQKLEALGTLTGGIAHDFNNILVPILGNTEMLLEDFPEDSSIRDRLNGIFKGALRARDLTKQILTFSRQGSGELRPMRIPPIIKEVLKLIRTSIPKTIEIKQDIGNNCGMIKADPTQIHQIIMNLAINAYHAMEDTVGELKVSLREILLDKRNVLNSDMEPGTYACLTVADKGIGMDKDLLEKIFDPFFTTKGPGKGTGMGLSVVHGIVKKMGGAIQVYSEPGEGTEFHVYLPVVENSSEKHRPPTKEAIRSGTEQILFVDDEESIVKVGKQMLERLGYQVTLCAGSIEALEVFRADPDKFDLVITDMAMPNMPGDKLSAELGKIRSDIPILLCSGFNETISEEKAAFLGINGFLLKPSLMTDFSQKIRDVLDENKTVKMSF